MEERVGVGGGAGGGGRKRREEGQGEGEPVRRRIHVEKERETLRRKTWIIEEEGGTKGPREPEETTAAFC